MPFPCRTCTLATLMMTHPATRLHRQTLLQLDLLKLLPAVLVSVACNLIVCIIVRELENGFYLRLPGSCTAAMLC